MEEPTTPIRSDSAVRDMDIDDDSPVKIEVVPPAPPSFVEPAPPATATQESTASNESTEQTKPKPKATSKTVSKGTSASSKDDKKFKAPKTPNQDRINRLAMPKKKVASSPTTPHPSLVSGQVNQLRGTKKTVARSPTPKVTSTSATLRSKPVTSPSKRPVSTSTSTFWKDKKENSLEIQKDENGFLMPPKKVATSGSKANAFQSKLFSGNSPTSTKRFRKPALPASSTQSKSLAESKEFKELVAQVNSLKEGVEKAREMNEDLKKKLADETEQRLNMSTEFQKKFDDLGMRLI